MGAFRIIFVWFPLGRAEFLDWLGTKRKDGQRKAPTKTARRLDGGGGNQLSPLW